MVQFRLSRWVGGLAVGVGISSGIAQAQFPVTSGPPIVMQAPDSVPQGSYVSPTTAPALGSRGISYALPWFSEERRKARTANRYTVARPVYAGRPGVSFAPYSDYYFPRTIGARETVYTAAPSAPVEVGYRAFAKPGTPVFPR